MSAEDRRKCPYLKGFRALKGVSIRKVTIGCITQKIIGKDEVPSSNLGSSSKKKDTTKVVSFFLGLAGKAACTLILLFRRAKESTQATRFERSLLFYVLYRIMSGCFAGDKQVCRHSKGSRAVSLDAVFGPKRGDAHFVLCEPPLCFLTGHQVLHNV